MTEPTEQPAKVSPTITENLTLDNKPEIGTKKNKDVGQPLEQPNTNAMIVKTIQGLMTCVFNDLGKLEIASGPEDKRAEQYNLKHKALEEIDLFERITLFKLQRAFE